MKTQQFRAVKISDGRYQIGKLIMVRGGWEWYRIEGQGGGRLGLTLREIVEAANNPTEYAHRLALGLGVAP